MSTAMSTTVLMSPDPADHGHSPVRVTTEGYPSSWFWRVFCQCGKTYRAMSQHQAISKFARHRDRV